MGVESAAWRVALAVGAAHAPEVGAPERRESHQRPRRVSGVGRRRLALAYTSKLINYVPLSVPAHPTSHKVPFCEVSARLRRPARRTARETFRLARGIAYRASVGAATPPEGHLASAFCRAARPRDVPLAACVAPAAGFPNALRIERWKGGSCSHARSDARSRVRPASARQVRRRPSVESIAVFMPPTRRSQGSKRGHGTRAAAADTHMVEMS